MYIIVKNLSKGSKKNTKKTSLDCVQILQNNDVISFFFKFLI